MGIGVVRNQAYAHPERLSCLYDCCVVDFPFNVIAGNCDEVVAFCGRSVDISESVSVLLSILILAHLRDYASCLIGTLCSSQY